MKNSKTSRKRGEVKTATRDHPALVKYGPLNTNIVVDALAIAKQAIAQAEGKDTPTMSHTATPWHMNNRRIEVANRPQVIADVRTQTDAEFIVRACNSHAALVEALKAMLEAYAPKLRMII